MESLLLLSLTLCNPLYFFLLLIVKSFTYLCLCHWHSSYSYRHYICLLFVFSLYSGLVLFRCHCAHLDKAIIFTFVAINCILLCTTGFVFNCVTLIDKAIASVNIAITIGYVQTSGKCYSNPISFAHISLSHSSLNSPIHSFYCPVPEKYDLSKYLQSEQSCYILSDFRFIDVRHVS